MELAEKITYKRQREELEAKQTAAAQRRKVDLYHSMPVSSPTSCTVFRATPCAGPTLPS